MAHANQAAAFHSLDAALLRAGSPQDPVSLDVEVPGEPIECPCCQGAKKVVEREGDLVPAPFVAAGGGDTVRDGRTCPYCLGEGVVEVVS